MHLHTTLFIYHDNSGLNYLYRSLYGKSLEGIFRLFTYSRVWKGVSPADLALQLDLFTCQKTPSQHARGRGTSSLLAIFCGTFRLRFFNLVVFSIYLCARGRMRGISSVIGLLRHCSKRVSIGLELM